jgi:hypothetical protein
MTSVLNGGANNTGFGHDKNRTEMIDINHIITSYLHIYYYN